MAEAKEKIEAKASEQPKAGPEEKSMTNPEMEEMRAFIVAMKEAGITPDKLKDMMAAPKSAPASVAPANKLTAKKQKEMEKRWDATYKAVHREFKEYILMLKQRNFMAIPQLCVVTIDNLNGEDTQFIGSAGYTVKVPKQEPVCMPVNFADELRKATKPYKSKDYMGRMSKQSKQERRKAALALRIHVTPKKI